MQFVQLRLVGGFLASAAIMAASSQLYSRASNLTQREGAAFWSVAATPAVTIGTRSGDEVYAFKTLRAVSRTTDGSIVALDDGLGVVRVYDATGKHVTTFGGRGDAPGKFDNEHLQAQLVGRDTILTYEVGRGRVQAFVIRQGFAGRRQVSPVALVRQLPRDATEPSPILMPGGDFLVITGSAREPAAALGAVTRPLMRAYWATRDFEGLRSLGAYRGRESMSVPPLSFAPPFPASLAYGWDPSGRRVCIGDTMVSRIECHDRSGRSIVVAWNHVSEPIADSSIRAWKAGLLERRSANRSPFPSSGREALASVRLKSMKPAFASIEVDIDLNVWVNSSSRQPAGKPGRTYAVFDPTGRHLGDVAMPPFDVMEIHSDLIVGIAADSVGGQRIVLHRLMKQ